MKRDVMLAACVLAALTAVWLWSPTGGSARSFLFTSHTNDESARVSSETPDSPSLGTEKDAARSRLFEYQASHRATGIEGLAAAIPASGISNALASSYLIRDGLTRTQFENLLLQRWAREDPHAAIAYTTRPPK